MRKCGYESTCHIECKDIKLPIQWDLWMPHPYAHTYVTLAIYMPQGSRVLPYTCVGSVTRTVSTSMRTSGESRAARSSGLMAPAMSAGRRLASAPLPVPAPSLALAACWWGAPSAGGGRREGSEDVGGMASRAEGWLCPLRVVLLDRLSWGSEGYKVG